MEDFIKKYTHFCSFFLGAAVGAVGYHVLKKLKDGRSVCSTPIQIIHIKKNTPKILVLKDLKGEVVVKDLFGFKRSLNER